MRGAPTPTRYRNMLTRLLKRVARRARGPGAEAAALIEDAQFAGAATRVLVMADGAGATQRISFDLPLQRLRETGAVGLAMWTETRFADAEALSREIERLAPHIVVASRYGGPHHEAITGYCKRAGARLVAHFDDDLFAVPEWLGRSKFEKYNDPARQRSMAELCRDADVLYLSTQNLKARFDGYGFGTESVAGRIYCPAPAQMKAESPDTAVFGYMGTAGHAEDLAEIVPDILAVLRDRPEARFETFGSIRMPSELQSAFPDRVAAIPPTADYGSFLETMKTVGWKVGLAPLQRNPFNDCKANTKCIEYLSAGVFPVLATGPVYEEIAGLSNLPLTSRGQWSKRISELLDMPGNVASPKMHEAQARIAAAYSLSALERQLCLVLGLDPAGHRVA